MTQPNTSNQVKVEKSKIDPLLMPLPERAIVDSNLQKLRNNKYTLTPNEKTNLFENKFLDLLLKYWHEPDPRAITQSVDFSQLLKKLRQRTLIFI